jgi:hypothetical protein
MSAGVTSAPQLWICPREDLIRYIFQLRLNSTQLRGLRHSNAASGGLSEDPGGLRNADQGGAPSL